MNIGIFTYGTRGDLQPYVALALGLMDKENLAPYLDKQKILDLYCLSRSLIPQPKDWEDHHKITGFINIPKQKRENHFLDQTPKKLSEWLANGEKPIYTGFGSNGVGNTEKVFKILKDVLEKTTERIYITTNAIDKNTLKKRQF